MNDRPVTLAAITGAHGVAGEVRLKLFAESLDSLKPHKTYSTQRGPLTLTGLRPDKAGAIARFAEITDRNSAEAHRGLALTVPRSALPPLAEGEYYHCDILGLPCVSSTGKELGQIVAIEDFGAGDIVEIERPGGQRFMVPMQAVELGEALVTVDDAFTS